VTGGAGARAASSLLKRLPTLSPPKPRDADGSGAVEPADAEQLVAEARCHEYDREVHAGAGAVRIRDDGVRPQRPAYPELLDYERPHYHYGQAGDHDAPEGGLWSVALDGAQQGGGDEPGAQ